MSRNKIKRSIGPPCMRVRGLSNLDRKRVAFRRFNKPVDKTRFLISVITLVGMLRNRAPLFPSSRFSHPANPSHARQYTPRTGNISQRVLIQRGMRLYRVPPTGLICNLVRVPVRFPRTSIIKKKLKKQKKMFKNATTGFGRRVYTSRPRVSCTGRRDEKRPCRRGIVRACDRRLLLA